MKNNLRNHIGYQLIMTDTQVHLVPVFLSLESHTFKAWHYCWCLGVGRVLEQPGRVFANTMRAPAP